MLNSIRPFVVGIAGGTGAGKTFLAMKLCERHREAGVCFLDQDSYYLDRGDLNEEERSVLNFDEPSAMDHMLLSQHLERLRSGQAVKKPRYCFVDRRRKEGERIHPAPLVVLEGLFAFWDPRVCSMQDLKIFVEADADLRFIRRLRRDLVERGRTAESVIAQYLKTVRPMHRLYVESMKKAADLVVSNEGPPEKALVLIEQEIARRGEVPCVNEPAQIGSRVIQ